MGLKYVVVTSVTRDDLPDGGAGHFASTIAALRNAVPGIVVEVLVPDFGGDRESLEKVVSALPDVLNHNLETVSRLYSIARPQADYRRSLGLLRLSSEMAPSLPLKTGLMLGMGESTEEVEETLGHILDTGCGMLTLGQYLSPSGAHMKVSRYLTPGEFEFWRGKALEMGFTDVASGPFVRSSYHADILFANKGTG
jgi:lipoic acid synthetase